MRDNIGFVLARFFFNSFASAVTSSLDLRTEQPTSARPSWLKLVAAWAFGLGLLGWLLHHTPLPQVVDAFGRPSWIIWCVTIGGIFASYLIRSARLQVVLDLESLGRPTRHWLGLRTDALRVILMHNAAVNLLPMRAGELSFPWLASRELGMPVSRAIACLLWMRMQDLLVLLLLGLMVWPGLPLTWRLAGLLSAVGGWFAVQFLVQRVSPQQTNSGIVSKVRAALTESAHHRPAAWALTTANWCLKLSAGACMLDAIAGSGWLQAWSGALGGELAAVVPLQGPAGFGTYEAGVWAGLATQLPANSSALGLAVSAALALHICFIVCAVLAGLAASALTRWRSAPPGTN